MRANNIIQRLHFTKLFDNISDKNMFVLIYFILVVITFDTSIVKLSNNFIGSIYYSQNFYNILFICTAAIFGLGQFIMLRVVRHRTRESTVYRKLKLHTLSRVLGYFNYAMIAILLSVILEIYLISSYNIGFVIATIWISYGMALVNLGFLSYMFLRWFNRMRIPVILGYAAAMAMLSINIVITIAFMSIELGSFSNIIYPGPGVGTVGALNISSDLLNSLYIFTFVLSFIITWSATAILLNYYSRIIGKAKYWILVSIPLVYFLASFQPLIVNLFLPFREANPIIFGLVYTLTFSASKPAGAILFGIAFWALARNIADRKVRSYILICSYGMIILFAANQPLGLLLTPYPPFSLATVAFMAVASFLVLIGIYSTAVSVALDTALRQSIRKAAIGESHLLDKIGVAEYEREIEKRVMMTTRGTRDLIESESGVASSLSDEEIREYIAKVTEEIKNKKSL